MDFPQHILIIGFVWPEPKSSAAGIRMLQLIALFKANEWKVTFASPAQESPFMADLAELGVTTEPIALNSDTFDSYIRDLNPTIVLFDRFMVEEQFGWRVAKNCPDALRILDTEDLHCLRLSRQKAFKEKRQHTDLDLLSEPVAKREIASILRCDLSLIISEVEMEILNTVFNIDSRLLHYLPLFAEENSMSNRFKLPEFAQRTDFIFIGNFLHEPNADAVKYLQAEIWPLISKKTPQAKLLIYGAYVPQKILQYNSDNFVVMGRAENALEVLGKARVLLAPLRFGAGLKGKLIDAMQVGTPNVTSSIGEEGISGGLQWNGTIADNPEQFASAAFQLYIDSDAWQTAQRNGYEIIEKRFLKDNFSFGFIEQILSVQKSLESHRRGNFIGSMLLHHTMASTKYMSKWIEAKNKT